MRTPLAAIILVNDGAPLLWPLARPALPFACLPFLGGLTLLESAWNSLTGIVEPERIIVAASPESEDIVRRLLPALPGENCVPSPQPGLFALAAAGALLAERWPDAIVIETRAAMIAGDVSAFHDLVHDAARLAHTSDCLVTCGIAASEERAGYDCMLAGDACVRSAHVTANDIREYRADADLAVAARFFRGGRAWWDSGIHVWQNSTFNSELARHCPELYAAESGPSPTLGEGLLARTRNNLLLPATLVWDPLQSWADIVRYIRGDRAANALVGNVLVDDVSGSIIYNSDETRLVAASGLRNMLVVQSPAAVMVCRRDDEAGIARIVDTLARTDSRYASFL